MNETGVSAGIQTLYNFGEIKVFIEVNVTQNINAETHSETFELYRTAVCHSNLVRKDRIQ